MTDSSSPELKPARRRPFDKETATTWLLAGLLGFGGGAVWRLARVLANDAPSVAVSYAEQEPLSVYLLPPDALTDSLPSGAEASSERATIVLVRGQGQASVATTRAS